MEQHRIYHARHQPYLSFPGATNVGHEPSQSGSTLDGFGSRDLQAFAESKTSIQLYTQVLNALFPLDFMSMTSKASVFSAAIFRHLLCNQRFARHRLSLILSSRIPTSSAVHTTSASSAKPIMLIMSTTAWMASTIDLPFRKLNWFSERPFSPTM